MSKSTIERFIPAGDPEEDLGLASQLAGPSYDPGAQTAMPRLAWPVARAAQAAPADLLIVGSGEPCIDCGGTECSFHALAQFKDGRWVGPEGATMAALIKGGYFAGTPEAAERRRATERVMEMRGVFLRNEDYPEGRPEFRPLTVEQLREQHREYGRGAEALREREQREKRGEVQDLQELARAVLRTQENVAALAETLKGAVIAPKGDE